MYAIEKAGGAPPKPGVDFTEIIKINTTVLKIQSKFRSVLTRKRIGQDARL